MRYSVLGLLDSKIIRAIYLIRLKLRMLKLRLKKGDVVITGVEPLMEGLTLAGKNVRKVLVSHGTYGIKPFKDCPNMLKYRKALIKIDKITVSSNYTKNRIKNSGIEMDCEVVPHGIIPKDMSKKICKNSNRLIYVGAIKKRKGLKIIVEAMRRLPHTYLDVVGHINNDAYCNEIVENLPKNVTIHKEVSDKKLDLLYSNSAGFIMIQPTNCEDFEGFGLVYLEAMQYGLPCIGSYEGPSSEIIKDKHNGYVVDGEDINMICDAINKVVHKKLINKENCINTAKEFSWANRVNDYRRMYNIPGNN